jgi:hypothetical protein
VLLDQFSFINFFSHYHDWQWRAGDDFPGQAVRQIWWVSNEDRRMAICRGGPFWSFDMSSVDTFDTVIECGHRTGVGRVAIFRTQWWDTPLAMAAFNAPLAKENGLVPTAFVADGGNVSVEFEIDPATLHDCSAPPRPPADLRVVTNAKRSVTLAWAAVGGERTRYIIEAGLHPGANDALNLSLGRATAYTATRVTPATYYARVRAKNTCGTSDASNELRVVVP